MPNPSSIAMEEEWNEPERKPFCLTPPETVLPDEPTVTYSHTVAAVGYLSSVLASRAGAWDGDAPKWFPEPPEWLLLWNQALEETKDAV